MDELKVNQDVSSLFESHFGGLKDPRIERSKLYPLTEILFVVLSGSMRLYLSSEGKPRNIIRGRSIISGSRIPKEFINSYYRSL